ncbi:MAG: hypothetical protein ACRCT8_14820 [Lacipirellulaceae bacterium]
MNDVDRVYARILHLGLVQVRDAQRRGDEAAARAEVEYLHDLPTFLGDERDARHRWQWNVVTRAHAEWLESEASEEARKLARTLHWPNWRELERLGAELGFEPWLTAMERNPAAPPVVPIVGHVTPSLGESARYHG